MGWRGVDDRDVVPGASEECRDGAADGPGAPHQHSTHSTPFSVPAALVAPEIASRDG
jgi:hypothetical protein